MRRVPAVLAFVSAAGLALAFTAALSAAGPVPQGNILLFAPIREADQALQAARRSRAEELAPRDLRLAEAYFEDAAAALDPPTGPPDTGKAARSARLAAAQAKLAEARAVEVLRQREAGGAGDQYLRAIESDPKRMLLPPLPTMPEAAGEYRRRQREAAEARAARRAAEEAVERLRREGG